MKVLLERIGYINIEAQKHPDVLVWGTRSFIYYDSISTVPMYKVPMYKECYVQFLPMKLEVEP